MDERAVGVFDSGIGGLTVAAEIKKLLPNERIIYFGDTARVPYGTRGDGIIREYARQDCRFLMKRSVKAIVAACGTVSSVALDAVRGEAGEIPVYGVTLPAARYAAEKYPRGVVGVIGTPATVESGSFEKLIKRFAPECSVVSAACPLFVPLVESGMTEGEAAELIAREYIAPLVSPDALILGCTHFPLLAPVISRLLPGTELINTGECLARVLASELERGAGGADEYYVSDVGRGTRELANRIMGGEVELITASAE